MTLVHNQDYLYLPKMGMPSLQSGVSFGLIAITSTAIYYIPTMTQDARGYGLITLKEMNVDEINGLPFFDVVPSVASKLQSVSELDTFLTQMASQIQTSIVIPHKNVQSIKLGFFAGFTVQTTDKKVRFSVGGKRKDIQEFLTKKSLLKN